MQLGEIYPPGDAEAFEMVGHRAAVDTELPSDVVQRTAVLVLGSHGCNFRTGQSTLDGLLRTSLSTNCGGGVGPTSCPRSTSEPGFECCPLLFGSPQLLDYLKSVLRLSAPSGQPLVQQATPGQRPIPASREGLKAVPKGPPRKTLVEALRTFGR
jgi:hypothetical protein